MECVCWEYDTNLTKIAQEFEINFREGTTQWNIILHSTDRYKKSLKS